MADTQVRDDVSVIFGTLLQHEANAFQVFRRHLYADHPGFTQFRRRLAPELSDQLDEADVAYKRARICLASAQKETAAFLVLQARIAGPNRRIKISRAYLARYSRVANPLMQDGARAFFKRTRIPRPSFVTPPHVLRLMEYAFVRDGAWLSRTSFVARMAVRVQARIGAREFYEVLRGLGRRAHRRAFVKAVRDLMASLDGADGAEPLPAAS
ncbi:MAG: hypothetical protein Q9162_000841 [Coniocarpon cinnabarinum]